jgi:DNA repair exonuclease SbcCD ATPase subunit
MNTIVEAVGQDAVDIDEASHELAKKVLEPIGVRCSEQATSSWNAWESMQLLNMATSLEDYIDEIHNQIASVNEATQQVQEQQQEDETAFAQHTAALAQQEELTVLTEEIYTLRKEVEDMHTDAEKMSDETSSYLDKQKEQLLHFTSVMAEQSNTEERVKGRIAEQEKAIDDVQNKISHTRTLISITDKMMYHRLSYFQPEYVQLDLNINNVIKSEVGLKLDMNHDSAIHLGNINVNTKKFCDIFNNQDNMTDVYFTNVLSNDIVAGPLSETWMRNKEGEPFADICDIVRMVSLSLHQHYTNTRINHQ